MNTILNIVAAGFMLIAAIGACILVLFLIYLMAVLPITAVLAVL